MGKLEQYIEKQNKIILEDREKTLISLGLTEKVYSPNNKEVWGYPKCDYVNGEKKYYTEVAMQVTDEEYALILSKAKQVEAIKLREEQAKQRAQTSLSHTVTKKWVPVFKKPASEWSMPDEKEKIDTGRSGIASILRAVAWILGILSAISGVATALNTETFLPVLVSLGTGAIVILMFYAFASVLDYLAELTAIAKNGVTYIETNK